MHARPSVAPTQVWYVSYVGYNESAYASLLPAFDGGTVYVVPIVEICSCAESGKMHTNLPQVVALLEHGVG